MDRHSAIERLRTHHARLKAMGVARISLFGSVSRGASEPESDIDVAVRLDERFSHGGFDHFSRLEELRGELELLLGERVDLVEEPVRAQRLQQAIDRDRIVAFG